MIYIGDQIIAALRERLEYPQVIVKDFYSVAKVSPPMVTLNEMPGPGLLFPDGQPRIVRNSFQIEIYCSAGRVDGKAVTAIQAAKALMQQVDHILNSVYGLTQVGDMIFSPYITDQTIMRGVARYRGDIDTLTEIIYR